MTLTPAMQEMDRAAVNESPHKETDWLEVRIDVHSMAHEPLSAFLFDMECAGIVTEASPHGRLRAYFPPMTHPEMIQGKLLSFIHDLADIFSRPLNPRISYRHEANRDWGLAWRRFFHPDRVTPGLTIFPAWEAVPQTEPGHTIRMDPGPAFGTGLHPTTRMCLKALEQVGPGAAPWSLLDVGTGSGILAIYGAKLGAKPILAVDIDPEAISWAAHNIELNALSDGIELSTAPVAELGGGFSVLTANLILHEIDAIMSHLVRLTAPGGRLVLSGLLKHQVDGIIDSLSKRRMFAVETLSQEEWSAVIARREDEAA